MQRQGAYILYLDVQRPLTLRVGALKNNYLPAGRYAYVGSARRNIAGRIARHKRLAEQKTGRLHWHIDYLLAHPQVRLTALKALSKRSECDISHRFALRSGVSAPVPNFGSTDCRSGCRAHLYRLGSRRKYFLHHAGI